MSIGQRLVGIVILATSSVLFAQTTETKPPDVGSSGATNSQLSATPAPNPCSVGANAAEILTDTMGVDFGPYLTQVVKLVKQNWYNLMPPQVYPPIKKQGKLALEFVILKDGKVSGMAIRTSSGDVPLDRAAWASITASTPFPPLPKEFPGQILGLRFYYFYNLNPNGISISNLNPTCTSISITISPSADGRVPAGSTLQFFASGKDITEASVTWSVYGPGCWKSTCGTISDTGLYTAPANIPGIPWVIVEATSRTDTNVTAKSKVTVVQANPSH